MSQPGTKTIKLRRVKPVKQEIIEENLKPLKENIQKKKRAQEAYYENHDEVGVSPLIRDMKRRPVHQRLGRRVQFNGTNTSAIPPKRRLRKLETGFANHPYMKKTRVFTAQQRLNRIRANQREVMNSQMTNVPKRIKLRRTLPQQTTGGPTYLRVEVKNNNARTNWHQNNQGVQKFKQILKPQLQQEIKKIQMDYEGGQTITPFSITPSATNITLHSRFGQLS